MATLKFPTISGLNTPTTHLCTAPAAILHARDPHKLAAQISHILHKLININAQVFRGGYPHAHSKCTRTRFECLNTSTCARDVQMAFLAAGPASGYATKYINIHN